VLVFASVVSGTLLLVLKNRELDDEIRTAKREGLPIEPADLRKVAVADSNNAAIPISTAEALMHFRYLNASISFSNAFQLRTDGMAGQLQFQDDKTLDELAPVLNNLRLASTRSQVDFHRQWEMGPTVLFPEYSDIRSCVSMLIADADRNGRNGRSQLEREDLIAAAKISALISQDPTIVATLISVSCQSQIESYLEMLLWSSKGKPELRAFIRDVVKSMGQLPKVKHALSGEIVTERAGIPFLASDKASEIFGAAGLPDSFRYSRMKRVRDAYDLRLVQYWRSVFRELPSDDSDYEAINQVFSKRQDWLLTPLDWTYDYVKLMNPTYTNLVAAIEGQLARRRALDTLLELMDEKAAGKTFTGTLSNSPDHLDPFASAPLKVIAKPDGWIVYSLGPDKIDDHGNRTSGFQRRTNIVFEYPAPRRGRRRMPRFDSRGALWGAS
jgi:hypothetical protein